MDSAFFILSKLIVIGLRIETWGLLILVLAFIAALRGRTRRSVSLMAVLFAGTGLVGAFPIGNLLLAPLEGRHAPPTTIEAPSGIILLGGGEEARRAQDAGLPEFNEAGDRVLYALALAQRFPEAPILFTGGSASLIDQESSGGHAMSAFFALAGISEDRVLIEFEARNTAENARNLAELVEDPASGPWLLVTSAFHMPRSVETFCGAGWRNIVPYPVDVRASEPAWVPDWDLAGHMRDINIALKEWVGLHVYRRTGQSLSPLGPDCLGSGTPM